MRALHTASLIFALSVSSAFAGTVSLFSTGVDDNGNLLAGGAVDPHYTAAGGATFVIDFPGALGWVGNTASSQWISADPGAFEGSTTFTTTFDLTGFDPSSASISGQLSADDGTLMFLNGNLVLDDSFNGGNAPWSDFVPFSASSGFVSGINTITFITPNSGGPGGLQVQILSAAAAPEPGTILLLGIGVSALLVRRKLRLGGCR